MPVREEHFMRTLQLDWNAAHRFVDERRNLGFNVKWDGWDIIFWSKTPKGFSHPRGSWRGTWGIETRVSPDNSGTWRIPSRYVNP